VFCILIDDDVILRLVKESLLPNPVTSNYDTVIYQTRLLSLLCRKMPLPAADVFTFISCIGMFIVEKRLAFAILLISNYIGLSFEVGV
jgi:hypothetical protein